MLVEFSVANYRSLHERQTLSLAKAKGDELENTNTFEIQAAAKFELLRSAAIYGPNAGGKSNFLRALAVMRSIVLDSASGQRGDALPVTPFRLSKISADAPSEFEVTFIVNQIRYQYGFSATEDRIHQEWLFAYPKGRPQRWFGREWEEEKQAYEWTLGSSLQGEKQLWQKSTRDNALFLSTAVQLNSQQLQPIYDWFGNTTIKVGDDYWGVELIKEPYEDEEKTKLLDFLRAADLGIEDVIMKEFSYEIEGLGNHKSLDIKTVHKGMDGELVNFDIDDESEGTQKLFSFAIPWMDSLAHGHVLVIDELHDNLHPRLVQFLVELFHNDESNPNNAQLIFTTHETSILNQEVFRRDQIWFCEKDEHQASTLYPLTDFSPRKGRENLELAYLSGRYGALPYVRPLREAG